MILGLFVLYLGTAGLAAADPISLTSGTIALYPDFSLATISAAGDGFSVAGSGLGGFLGTFTVGQTVDLSRRIAFTPRVQLTGFVGVDLQLNATPFVASQTNFQTGFSAPFTLTGSVEFFSIAPTFGGTPIFTQSVTGSGTVDAGGIPIGGGQFFANGGLLANFGPASTPSATPEPASVLLFGSGLLAAWRSRRFRRS
jgi:hypothetical protein